MLAIFLTYLTLVSSEPIKQWDDANQNIRIQIRAAENPNMIDISLIGKDNVGWVALGFGDSMAGSDIQICWPTSDGAAAVIQSKIGTSSGLNPGTAAITLNVSQSRTWSPGLFVCRFQRTISSIPKGIESNIIWAVSHSNPPDAAGSNIRQHDATGSVKFSEFQDKDTLDFFNKPPPTVASSPVTTSTSDIAVSTPTSFAFHESAEITSEYPMLGQSDDSYAIKSSSGAISSSIALTFLVFLLS